MISLPALRYLSVVLAGLFCSSPAWAEADMLGAPKFGLVADRSATPVVDPTENVKALTAAGFGRQDDLRDLEAKFLINKIEAAERISQLQYDHSVEIAKALADRIDAEARLRAEAADKLAQAEAKRIDAIRAVDVQAVASANEKSNATAATLANQVSQSAADLRTLVASTAATQSANQQQQFADIGKRISTLEQTASTNQGKSTYQDPAIASMSAQLAQIVARQNDTAVLTFNRMPHRAS